MIKCPVCKSNMNFIDVYTSYCPYCDKFFKDGNEVYFTESGRCVTTKELVDLDDDPKSTAIRYHKRKNKLVKVNVKKMRDKKEELRLSYKDIGKLINLSYGTISKHFTGYKISAKKTYKKYADILGVDLDEIYREQRIS